MHYYQFNIGDYMKSTRHLSIIEDIAYRRLLDLYYDTEKPLDLDVDKLVRLIGLKDYKTETQQILSEFFNETKKGFIQKRVQRELDKYSAKATAARENGKLGGRPKKTQPVNSANLSLTQSKAKQEPITTNHKPKERGKRFKPPSVQEVDQYCFDKEYSINAEAFIGFYESNGWKVGKNPMKNWKAALTTWQKRNGGNNGASGQGQNNGFDNRSRAQKVSDKLDEIAKRDIEQNGFTSELDSGSV